MNEATQSHIGSMTNGTYHLRGTPLSELMHAGDFISVTWLAWTGSLPSDNERKLLETCFVACVDHGTEPPSTHTARVVASCGKPLADAVAAGILTLGPRHGNAAGAASAWVRDAVSRGAAPKEIVDEALQGKARIPGLGHPVYDVDPRTTVLFTLAKEVMKEMRHADFITEVAKTLSEKKGKPMPVNVDGAIGAIIADLGADAELADAIFLSARTIGLVAHAREEAAGAQSYKRG